MNEFRKLLRGATIEGEVKIRTRSGKLLRVSLTGNLKEVRSRFWALHKKYHFRTLSVYDNWRYVGDDRIRVYSRSGIQIAHFTSSAGFTAFVIWLRSIREHLN